MPQANLALPPPADARLAYGTDPNQFGEIRFPKGLGPFPVVVNLHGGFWRAAHGLAASGHLCAALTAKGLVTWNLEYRRVGQAGGGWPGTFADVRNGYRFLSTPEITHRYHLDLSRVLVMGHSAGGQLALCLAGHEESLKHVISLAGVVDLRQAEEEGLGDNAVLDFLGGKPAAMADHYREADPAELKIKATQWLIHGASDDIVPSSLSRNYTEQKKSRGEDVHYLEIARAGHFELIDPRSPAWSKVESTLLRQLG